ncbi:MAG: preprotein translocase subunit SecG, partial [Verrucomicrobia bacterium]|nr:preprotein translocase subunit SecG [Verrucomicrobiota bacterium]
MSLLIGLLTLILVLTSLLLVLLILIQLPKKDAGAGLAFGGAASDALFGAGSGNVLTRITKYATVVFLGLSLLLAVLQGHHSKATSRGVVSELEKRASTQPVSPPPSASATTPSIPTLQSAAASNLIVLPTNATASPALPAPEATGAPPATVTPPTAPEPTAPPAEPPT